jgi:hypothetical protein
MVIELLSNFPCDGLVSARALMTREAELAALGREGCVKSSGG